jgi:hypothetical protein
MVTNIFMAKKQEMYTQEILAFPIKQAKSLFLTDKVLINNMDEEKRDYIIFCVSVTGLLLTIIYALVVGC